jgi:hypothetical protein
MDAREIIAEALRDRFAAEFSCDRSMTARARMAEQWADGVLAALLDNGYAVVSSTSPAGSEGPKGPGDTVSAVAKMWWVTTDKIVRGGRKVCGPFSTPSDAVVTLEYIKEHQGGSYCVDATTWDGEPIEDESVGPVS